MSLASGAVIFLHVFSRTVAGVLATEPSTFVLLKNRTGIFLAWLAPARFGGDPGFRHSGCGPPRRQSDAAPKEPAGLSEGPGAQLIRGYFAF